MRAGHKSAVVNSRDVPACIYTLDWELPRYMSSKHVFMICIWHIPYGTYIVYIHVSYNIKLYVFTACYICTSHVHVNHTIYHTQVSLQNSTSAWYNYTYKYIIQIDNGSVLMFVKALVMFSFQNVDQLIHQLKDYPYQFSFIHHLLNLLFLRIL